MGGFEAVTTLHDRTFASALTALYCTGFDKDDKNEVNENNLSHLPQSADAM